MSRIGRAIESLLTEHGWDIQELARRTGLAASTISRHIHGHSTPHYATRRRYAQAAGETVEQFDQRWRTQRVPQQQPEPGALGPLGTPGDGIPVLRTVPAGAGDQDPANLGLDNGLGEWYIPRQLVGVSDPTAFALHVEGQSMSPQYQHGDIVICSPQAQHEEGMAAAVRLSDGQCTLKFIHARPDGRLELRPANDRHPLRIIEREDVVNVARVVGRYQRLYQAPPPPPPQLS